ncbi:hypothetical protein [Mythimna sequax nucleopolyhedrovirus]|nr:hypothetical protein [Mythimna sequax nucleopolyhedrovirus]
MIVNKRYDCLYKQIQLQLCHIRVLHLCTKVSVRHEQFANKIGFVSVLQRLVL